MLGEQVAALEGAPEILDVVLKHCCVYICVLVVDQCFAPRLSALLYYFY